MRKQIEWVKQAVASAPGTGDIVLGAAVSGFVGLAGTFDVAEGDMLEYTVTDGVNRERGIGRYRETPNRIERVKVKATLNNGVYGGGAPLTLTGSAVVSCESVANDSEYDILGLSGFKAWVPRTGTSVDSIGLTPNIQGTASASTGVPRRIRYTSATTTGAILYWQDPVLDLRLWDGNRGGFVCEFQFNIIDSRVDALQFYGVRGSSGNPASAADPSTFGVGTLGVGSHDSSGNLFFYDGVGAPIDIGMPSNGDTGLHRCRIESRKDIVYSLSLDILKEDGSIFKKTIVNPDFNTFNLLQWAPSCWRSNPSSGPGQALAVDFGAFVMKSNI